MSDSISRRDALKTLGVSSLGMMFAGKIRGAEIDGTIADIVVGGEPVEIAVWTLSRSTVRITVHPIRSGSATAVPYTGALDTSATGTRVATTRDSERKSGIVAGD